MKVGYARVSSKGQNLDRQIEGLSDVSKLFTDKLSGKSTDRPQFQAMLDFIREGDIVVVTELERLGRNNKELTETMLLIQQKGATLEVLNLPTLRGIEDGNLRRLINNLIIEIYKYQAESERKNILEKQAQGIKIAKKNGKFKGGKLKYKENDPKLQHAFKLYLEGETEKDIERITGINRRTFRRYRERFNIQRNKEME
nr:recombinase family protein [Enterococcus faecalis]